VSPGQATWHTIQTHSEQQRRVWLTYVVCAIKNDGSQATPFTLDLKKFFITHDGKKQFFADLKPYEFEDAGNSLVATPGITPIVAEAFHKDTTVAPAGGSIAIAPHTTAFLSVAFRIIIPVSEAAVGENQMLTISPPLQYNGSPVLLLGRHRPPVGMSQTVTKPDFPTACRPSG